MKFEDVARRITGMQVRSPLLFIGVFVIITLLMLPGMFRLVDHVEPSLEKVLPQEVDEVKTMNDMRAQFGADMMYLVVYAEPPVHDVRTPGFVRYLDALTEKLRGREHIDAATSIADTVVHQHGYIPDDARLIEQTLDDPQAERLMNMDYSFAVIQIRSDTGADAGTIGDVIEGIEQDIQSLEGLNPGSRIQVTGFNAIDRATFEVIMSDFARITLVSMALVGIVVFLTFRKLGKTMMPMIVVITALLWTMGIVGYAGMTITVVSMVAAAMIMGLGIDFGIHVVHGYYGLRKEGESGKDALSKTMEELLRAMVGASLTTIAGFLALLFGVLPAMKNLGVILGIGIFTTLLGAVFLLPAIVYMYDRRATGGISQ